MADRSQPDANNIHSLIAVSTADGVSPVTLWADPVTHSLVTSGSGGGGASGTQYTQGGATVANPTGTAQIYFDGSGNPKAVTPSTPLPVSQTDGTNSANVLKGDGTSAGNNALKVAGSYQELAGLSAGSLNADLVPSTDVSGYKTFSLQIIGTYSGTLSFQGSNDNTNFSSVTALNITGATSSNNPTTTVTGLYQGDISYRYLRVRMTAYASGTATGTLELYSSVAAKTALAANQSGTWTFSGNTAAAGADTGNPVKIGGVFNTSPPIYTTGQRGDAQIDARGSMVVQIATAGVYITGVDDNTDAQAVVGTASRLAVASRGSVFNGTSWDRIRSATSAAGTTGTGVPAAGMLGFDGTNYQRVKTDTSGNPQVTGTVADGVADAGNPVKVGAKYNATQPTYVDGQRGDLQIGPKGSLRTELWVPGSAQSVAMTVTNADGSAVGSLGTRLEVVSRNYGFNGTSFDRTYNNWASTTGDTGARTASFAGATQTNYNAAGANIVINMGAVSGTTPTLTAQVQGSADGGTTWFNITGAVTPSITATGVYVLTVYPGITAVANASVPMNLPRTWRLNYTIGGTTPSFTITNVQVAYNN